eukprot:15339787-Ditylum_brightwellii.AAC.1
MGDCCFDTHENKILTTKLVVSVKVIPNHRAAHPNATNRNKCASLGLLGVPRYGHAGMKGPKNI